MTDCIYLVLTGLGTALAGFGAMYLRYRIQARGLEMVGRERLLEEIYRELERAERLLERSRMELERERKLRLEAELKLLEASKEENKEN